MSVHSSKHTARDIIETLTNDISFKMIFVEGGTFDMGSDKYLREFPIHKVKLDDFYIGQFPVTQAVWCSLMKNNPSFFVDDNRPVEQVSWNKAQVLIQKLNQLTGKKYCLPTEAQWEYAARGGQLSQGFKYAGSDKLEEVGWYRENSHWETKIVGMKVPNELGLFDMSGNVSEWCQDWYSDRYYQRCIDEGKIENPEGPESGVYRTVRGGHKLSFLGYCRSAARDFGDLVNKDYRDNSIGFRLALLC